MSASERPRFVVSLKSRRVQNELDALAEPDYRRVWEALHSLAYDPRPFGCKKLFDDVYRIRVGSYRIVYLVDVVSRTIAVGGIRRRSERTYKGLREMFN